MYTISRYKELQPKYGEWLPILEQLGFEKKVVEKEKFLGQMRKVYRLENSTENFFFILPYLPDDALVMEGFYVSCTSQLYWLGLIENEQDMVKMIEKKRLALGNQPAFSA
jgi:hypothetical protein